MACDPATQVDLLLSHETLLQQAVTRVTHDQRTRTVIVSEDGVGSTAFVDRLRQRLAERTGSGEVLATCAPAIHVRAKHTPAAFCVEVLRAALFMRKSYEVRAIAADTLADSHAITSLVGAVATLGAFWDRVALIVEERQRIDSASECRQSGPNGSTPTHEAGYVPTPSASALLQLAAVAIRVAARELDRGLVFFVELPSAVSLDDGRLAAGLCQDVRDLLLTDSSRWVVSGSRHADRLILRASSQVRSIFPMPLVVPPSWGDEVGVAGARLGRTAKDK